MSPDVDFEEIKDYCEIYGITLIDNEEIRIKCLNLCKKFGLTNEQFAVNWLAFAAPHSIEEVTLQYLDDFETEFKKQPLKTKEKSTFSSERETLNSSAIVSDVDNDLLASYGASPAVVTPSSINKTKGGGLGDAPRQSALQQNLEVLQSQDDFQSFPLAPSLTHTQPSQGYAHRPNSGEVIASYGNNVDVVNRKADFSHSPEVKELACGGEQPLKALYNFMFEKLRDSAKVLDYSIQLIGKEIMTAAKIEEVASLDYLSNEWTWYVGRICCDSVGRLNAASVMLEGDREESFGAAVKLDLSKLKSYSLFSGQVVAVKGYGSAGKCVVVEDIITGKILPPPESPLSMGNQGLQIQIACGPFTTLENLMYEPLTDLLQNIAIDPPHFLFLLGPLVDISHPCLDDPSLSDSYDSVFGRCIKKISTALKSTGTTVYIVANQSDVCSIPIYPTPPVLPSISLEAESCIKVLPDPCLLGIDGVALGLTTIDYPMHMNKEEISFSPSVTDRMARLSRHILLQQSFYPIYPPPEGTNMHLEQADLHTRLPFTPHIIITPSDLKSYVKKIDGCVFINPGRLTKGRTGGYYCKLNVRSSLEGKETEINAKIHRI